MGKAAKNESRKLEATFYNNLAVGIGLTGFFVPYLFIFQEWINATFLVGSVAANIEKYGAIALGTTLAAVIGHLFREAAQRTIREIED